MVFRAFARGRRRLEPLATSGHGAALMGGSALARGGPTRTAAARRALRDLGIARSWSLEELETSRPRLTWNGIAAAGAKVDLAFVLEEDPHYYVLEGAQARVLGVQVDEEPYTYVREDAVSCDHSGGADTDGDGWCDDDVNVEREITVTLAVDLKDAKGL